MIAAAARRAIRQAVSHLPSRTLYPPGQRLSITSSSCVSERIKSWGRLKASQTMVSMDCGGKRNATPLW